MEHRLALVQRQGPDRAQSALGDDRQFLTPIYTRFTEGFALLGLHVAKVLCKVGSRGSWQGRGSSRYAWHPRRPGGDVLALRYRSQMAATPTGCEPLGRRCAL